MSNTSDEYLDWLRDLLAVGVDWRWAVPRTHAAVALPRSSEGRTLFSPCKTTLEFFGE